MKTKTKTYTVQPLNDIKENTGKFDWAYSDLSTLSFKTPATKYQEIELIKCTSGTTEEILKEIDERGYIAAPSPYVLGLGVQHPAVIKEYGWIVSLDENNVLLDDDGYPCFLFLFWDGERNLDLAGRAGEWDVDWWFAVVRKSSQSLNSKPLNTKSLIPSDEVGAAISLLKKEGYIITKEF